MTIKRSPWTGMVPVDDTALAVTDTDGDGVPVIYLNGHAAVQRQWRRVLAELGTEWRHITYDMRGRGKSKRSADYSFETNIRDVDAVLAARAVVVGWSYGTFVAAHWASRDPARTVGAVLVDGAQPYDWFDESMEPGMRKIWKRIWWPMQLLRPFGMAPRMTADQLRTIAPSPRPYVRSPPSTTGGTEDAAVTENPARENPDSRRRTLAQEISPLWTRQAGFRNLGVPKAIPKPKARYAAAVATSGTSFRLRARVSDETLTLSIWAVSFKVFPWLRSCRAASVLDGVIVRGRPPSATPGFRRRQASLRPFR